MVTDRRVSSNTVRRLEDPCISTTSPIFSEGTAAGGTGSIGVLSGVDGGVALTTGATNGNGRNRHTDVIFKPSDQRSVQFETIFELPNIGNVGMFIGFAGATANTDDLDNFITVSGNTVTAGKTHLAGLLMTTDFAAAANDNNFWYITAGGDKNTVVEDSGIEVVAGQRYGIKIDLFNSGGVRMAVSGLGHRNGQPYQLAGAIKPDETFSAAVVVQTHGGAKVLRLFRHTLKWGLS